MIRDKLIEKAVELEEQGDHDAIAKLGLSDDELIILGDVLEAKKQGEHHIPGDKPISSLQSMGVGLVDQASLNLADEAVGVLSAIKRTLFNPEDKRPFEEKYREAQKAVEEYSDRAYQENPKSYIAGGAAGLLGSGVGAAKAGLTGLKAASAIGATAGFGHAKGGDVEGTILETAGGALMPAAIEKVGIPLAKGVGSAIDESVGGAFSKLGETVKNKVLTGTEQSREIMRNLGRRFRNTSDIPKAIKEYRNKAIQHSNDIVNMVDEHLNDKMAGKQTLLHLLDQETKGQAFDGAELAGLVRDAEKKVRAYNPWLTTSAPEQKKISGVLDALTKKLKYGTEEAGQEAKLAKSQLEDYIHNNPEEGLRKELSEIAQKREESFARSKNKGPDDALQSFFDELNQKYPNEGYTTEMAGEDVSKAFKKFAIENDLSAKVAKEAEEKLARSQRKLSFKEADDLRATLQTLGYNDRKLSGRIYNNYFKGVIEDAGGDIKDPKIRKFFVDMEKELRQKLDDRAEEIMADLGMADVPTWKQNRKEVHETMNIRENLPTAQELKSYTDDQLSSGAEKVAELMDTIPNSEIKQKIQNKWQESKPDFETFSVLKGRDPRKGLGFREGGQFNYGAQQQNFSEGPFAGVPTYLARRGESTMGGMVAPNAMANAKDALSQTYVIPRDIRKVSQLTMGIIGLNDAMAGEELGNSYETADDVSLERGLGELAPMMEGLYQPSPIQTSKGRARSAIVDRSGVSARIVDPMERKVIRDDFYHNPTMSIMDKAKKTNKLNQTEKIDMDIQDAPQVPMVPQNQQIEMPTMDIYGELNRR